MENEGAVVARIHYHEYDDAKRFPLLVLELERGSVGYQVNGDGTLERTCICAARSGYECCCGGFDET